MSVSLEDLRYSLRERAFAALSRLEKNTYKIDRVFTTPQIQYALWMQGRFFPYRINAARRKLGMTFLTYFECLYTVTNCDGIPRINGGTGVSLHQWGCAIDICIFDGRDKLWPELRDERWIPIATAMKNEGFFWGGDWSAEQDPTHYYIIPNFLHDKYAYEGPIYQGSGRWQ